MTKFNVAKQLPVLALVAAGVSMSMSASANEVVLQEAAYNELGDLLSVTEAQGRFAWLKKCYDGLLVEMWETMFDTTAIVSKEEKLRQLEQLWLSQTKIAEGKAQYVSFANEDFSNPYNWYAGTSEGQSCSIKPPEYNAIALKTTVLPRKYCSNKSYDSDWEWISQVTVDGFNHQSGAAAGTMVSGKVLTLNANRNIQFTISPGFLEPKYPSYMARRVWIDWDHNGRFDANELIHSSAGEEAAQFNIDVPTDLPTGITLMRIAFDAGGGSDNACTRVHYGEVEDYLVTVR